VGGETEYRPMGAGFSQVCTYLCCTFLLPLLLRATGVLALYTCKWAHFAIHSQLLKHKDAIYI
jgi:hypothetical protein